MPNLIHLRRRVMGEAKRIPAGLIVPWTGLASNIPEGWNPYTLPGVRAIKHGPVAGQQGGTTTLNGTSVNTGGHVWGTGGAVGSKDFPESGSTAWNARGMSNIGAHAHSLQFTFVPLRRLQVLMQAVEAQKEFPVNTGLLSEIAVAGASDITPTGRLLCGQTADASSNPAQQLSVSWGAAGVHRHRQGTGAAIDQPGTPPLNDTVDNGQHTHTSSPSVGNDQMRKFWLGLWQAVEPLIPADGMYGLWEGSEPPDNWNICDGSNGTPDLTDYFIGFDAAQAGNQTGNGTISLNCGASNGQPVHGHRSGTSVNSPSYNAPHTNDSNGYSHGSNATSGSFEPLFYTLIVVKYAA